MYWVIIYFDGWLFMYQEILFLQFEANYYVILVCVWLFT